jgi:hypothetical protein
MPDLVDRRDAAAAALGLELPSAADVLARLCEVATGAGEEFTLVFTPEGTRYDSLFGDEPLIAG